MRWYIPDRRLWSVRTVLSLIVLLLLQPLAFSFLLPTSPVAAADVPAGFYDEFIAAATPYQTTAFAFLPDGRILIAEKAGRIKVYKNGVLLPTPMLDIHTRVNQYEDRGLLGLAVDPDFANGMPHIYITYTYDHAPSTDPALDKASRTVRISRFTVTGDVAANEEILLGTVTPSTGMCNDVPLQDCIPSDGTSHSGGGLRFAADGTLFATIGDGSEYARVNANAQRTQDPDWLSGKVLHFDRDGKGLAANPFVIGGDLNANRSKVWALGVRNAFRFGLQPGTNLPFVGDVGWDTWEEVNIATKGANLGWPCYEGNAQQPLYATEAPCQTLYAQGAGAVKAPLYTYNHTELPRSGTGSVVGGAFYTGTSYPAQYQGAFFFGDYSKQFIRFLRVDGSNQLVPNSVTDFAANNGGAVDIQVSPTNGDLYYIAIVTGELHHIGYGTPPPPPPVTGGYLSNFRWISATNGYGPVELDKSNGDNLAGDGNTLTIKGQLFTKGLGTHAVSDIKYGLAAGGCDYFTAKIGVDDEVGGPGSVIFKVYGDNTVAPLHTSPVMHKGDAAIAITVPMGGNTTLRLVAEDAGDGIAYDHADWAEAKCSQNQPPQNLTIVTPVPTLTYKIGDQIAYNATATDPEGGQITYAWQLITRHCPSGGCHSHPSQLPPGQSGTFVVNDHDDASHLELVVTATDPTNQQSTTSVQIYPQQAQLTLQASPAGLNVVYAGQPAAPTITQMIDVGGTRSATAPSPQVLNGQSYIFQQWSDGITTAQRTLTMTATGLNLTAVYTLATPTPTPTVTPPTPTLTPTPTKTPTTVPSTATPTVTPTPPQPQRVGPGQASWDGTRLVAQPNPDALFLGWSSSNGQSLGWANPYTPPPSIPIVNIVASFAARPTFSDLAPQEPGLAAIQQLAARGVIKGYVDGTFGPTNQIQRAEAAVMLVRAFGWSQQPSQSTFTDELGVGPELWRAVGILAQKGIAKGYNSTTFGSRDPVTMAQTVSFITRSMVATGVWIPQPDPGPGALYPNISLDNAHRQDIVTFVYYAGGLWGSENLVGDFGRWDQPSSRAWFAATLWQALDRTYGRQR